MFKKKSMLSLGLVMAMAVAGCGDAETTTEPTKAPEATEAPAETPAATEAPAETPAATEAPAETTPAPTEAPAASYEAGKVVDFEDGNFSFVAIKESLANSAAVELEVADFAGSKALKAVATDTSKVPFVAIDISSLAGDAIESVRTIEMDMGVTADDGNFYAVAGAMTYYWGEANTEVAEKWSVYMESKNPKRASVTLAADEAFAAGAKNIIIISKTDDNAKGKIGSMSTFYIDNIVLKDADGNAITLNTAATFDAPDGFADIDFSNLTPVKNETVIPGFEQVTGGSWWPADGVSVDPAEGHTLMDIDAFKSGQILTATVKIPDGIEDWQKQVQFILQCYVPEGSEMTLPTHWPAGATADGLGEVTVKDTEAIFFVQMHLNDSLSLAQISYDEIAAYLNDPDWIKYASFMSLRDAGYALEVSSVTVGEEKKVLPKTVNDVAIEGFAVSAGAWAQAGVNCVADGGTFDPSLLKPGTVVTINYKSAGPIWLVTTPRGDSGAEYGWTRIAQYEAATNDDNNQAQITYDQIVAAIGTTDVESMAFLQCESDQDWEVYSVTIGEFAPEAKKVTNEVVLDDTAVSGGAWSQAGANSVAWGGTFDPSIIKPGTVLSAAYKENGGKYWFVVVPVDGAPYGWSRVGNGDNGVTSLMDPAKGVMQITYDQLVAALGTDDMTTIGALQVESDTDWEIYSISVGDIAE